MIRALKTAALVALLGLFVVPWAHAADLNADYLIGRWAIDAKDCSSPDVETIEFRKNGTFEGIRSGEVETVGFLRIDKELVVLNIVSSPAYYSDIDPTGSVGYEQDKHQQKGHCGRQLVGVYFSMGVRRK